MFSSHNHGGQLRRFSQIFGIPLADWLDVSTGISPWAYPLPPVPPVCWQRLPEREDGLESVAADYYGSPYLLAVSGSQEAIKLLPNCFPCPQRVGIVSPAYHSHQQAWQAQGHNVQVLNLTQVDAVLPTLDVLVVINPTNPTAHVYSLETLRQWHQILAQRGGCLVVDEAFMDVTPAQSLINHDPQAGLVVLRSVGKFFGLAGMRLGFVWAEIPVLQALAVLQGDWSVSHPARWAGQQALADQAWQQQQRCRLVLAGEHLHTLLQRYYGEAVQSTLLFSYLPSPHAAEIHQALAAQGILTRLFTEPAALRFGLPASETDWLRLEQGIYSCPR
ncbi:MAG: threonine-phosphate decarboxylase CobD [Thiothrix sp.]|uniref:threonine-phosphate decarboxylase CobD n=1 Tax=Thiothrix sp. TaxID=1032 RepID=UPI00261355FB|nr:threonine-phosphate decarboxylase CobD [Thiothrix sp.]MDD5395355.1 threonine-phosphate decarboxylase CobD [Thiothrix sp.]